MLGSTVPGNVEEDLHHSTPTKVAPSGSNSIPGAFLKVNFWVLPRAADPDT